MNIFSSGGFGDSLVCYAKYAHMDRGSFNVVHVEPYQHTLKNVKAFLDMNKVTCKMVKDKPNLYYERNRRVFQRAYSSYVYGNKSGCINHISGEHFPPSPHKEFDHPIDPFPPLSYNIMGATDIVVAVSAGRSLGRLFPLRILNNIIAKYSNRKITLIGKVSPAIYPFYNLKGAYIENLINKTTVQEAISIVGSSLVFYGNAGFFAYLAGMTRSEVFMIPEYCSGDYIHKKWDLKLIGV